MKENIRKDFLGKRNRLSPEEVKKKSKVIIEHLKKDPDYKKAKIILFYVSKDKEVLTHDLIREALKDKIVLVPKLVNEQAVCCVIKSFNELRPGSYGVLEPFATAKIPVEEVQLIIVPGVVFDKKGYRLGYGKGYYDALLLRTEAKKIALAFSFQIVEKLPHDQWDVKMDKVVTE